MWFSVRRLRQRGVAIARPRWQYVTRVTGDLRIEEQRVEALGRQARVATLYPLDRQVGEALLAPLLDAQLLWMSPLAMVLGGLELDGEAVFAQTWHCTPMSSVDSIAQATPRAPGLA